MTEIGSKMIQSVYFVSNTGYDIDKNCKSTDFYGLIRIITI